MIFINKFTGDLVVFILGIVIEMRLTSVGATTYEHKDFKSFEITNVILVGENAPDSLSDLEFLGWL